jgi:hypothetical protein
MNPNGFAEFIESEMKRGATQSEAVATASALAGRPITHAELVQAMTARPDVFPPAVHYKRLIR